MKSFPILITSICIILFSSLKSSAQYPTIDYSNQGNWITQLQQPTKQTVDVFYVYPTVYFDQKPTNMLLNDSVLRQESIGVFKEQASVFQSSCNIYAPFYRQMSIAVLSLSGEEYNKHFSIAYKDVLNAFDYYLEHLNNGRPFFLAGHSQGSLMLLNLMQEKFNDKDLKKQLIAAYIIGYSITEDDLKNYPWLNIAQSADDTGVIITYNTQSPDATGSPVLLPTAACVNPLNWTTQKTYASANLNLGAVFFNNLEEIDTEIPHFTDAQIGENNALIVNGPNPNKFYKEGTSFFPIGVYHKYDYQFFYRNLEQNIQTRKSSYLKSRE